MSLQNHNIGRIKEIDGLRGAAILLIVMSHFESSFFQSGGVSIFFVITGFFMTKIISDKGINFSIVDFYVSRVNGLYPQLLISTILIFFAYLFFGELDRMDVFLDSFLASISSTMNFYLIDQGDVYSNQSYINLFLPLWAFSIIFQFYVLYPIILKLFFLFTKLDFNKLFYILAFSTLLSYFVYIYFLGIGSEVGNFYHPFSRLWQFLLGGVVYSIVKIYKPKKNINFTYLGVALLVIWQFDLSQINFVYTTTIVSLSTALIILSVVWNHSKKVTIFSSQPLTQLGKVSYPLYLWHMPLIYLSSLYFDEFLVVVITLFGGIFFAYGQFWINHKVIVNHLLKVKYFKYIVFFISINIVLASMYALNNKSINSATLKSISTYFENNNLQNKLKSDFHKKYSNFDRLIAKDSNGRSCQTTELDFQCVYNKHGKNDNVILLGTSHLAALSQSLKDRLVDLDHSVTIITPPGCPYILNYYSNTRSWCSAEHMEKVRDFILKSSKPSIIILFTRYAYYIDGKLKTDPGFEVKEPVMSSIMESDIVNGFRKTYQDLADMGHKLVLIYPVPESYKHVPRELRKKVYNSGFSLNLDYSKFVDRTKSSFLMLDSIKSNNIYRFYPHKTFCDDYSGCITSTGGRILYNDSNHLSRHGSELIAPLILKLPVFNNENY